MRLQFFMETINLIAHFLLRFNGWIWKLWMPLCYEGHLDIVQNRHEYGTEWFDYW